MRIFAYRQRRKKIPALKENAGKGKKKLNNMALLVFLCLSPYKPDYIRKDLFFPVTSP
jgi:hypothetical protein